MTRYRAEVDGLRALAVVPVILFHAGFPAFAGGFVGVDVFFVISGYLIASIIVEEMRSGRFSFIQFFERRARRIIPALYAVLIATIPLGWLFMLPDNFENFGQSVVATVAVSNNILLLKTSGYWDLANEFKPLLHTWSLGVEEQFYLFFPLILLALVGRGARTTAWVLAGLALASLVGAQWFVATKPLVAFHLLPMRAWELLLGAIFAVTRRPDRPHQVAGGGVGAALSWTGLLLIVAPVFLFDESTPFPGVTALAPTVGTLLVLMFASEGNMVGRLLSTRALVGIGLASYSAYLWHQPLFAFIRLLSPEEPSTLVWIAAIAATGALAFLSWRFVERPFRSRERVSRGAVFALTIAVGALLAGAGLAIDRSAGFPGRLSVIGGAADGGGRQAQAAYVDRAFRLRTERFADDGRTKVLVLGNSYARDFLNMVAENGYMPGCELSYEPVNQIGEFSCIRDMERFTPSLRERLLGCDVLVMVMPIFDADCLAEDIPWLRAQGVPKIVVLGTKNFGWNPNAVLGMSDADARAYRARVLPDVAESNRRARERVPPECFVDVLALVADADGRVPVLAPDGSIISEDGGHLTRAGAKFVGQRAFTHPLLAPLRE